MSEQGRKIAIVGASGNIGGYTIDSLLSRGNHTITAISRKGSSATFPKGVIVQKGDYDDESFLVSALQGHDVVVVTLGFDSYASVQEQVIRAAANAGVKVIFPVEFGSDIGPNKLVAISPILQSKSKFRSLAQSLGLDWIAIVNNPWLDWSLSKGFWGIDIKNRTARLYDGGNTKFVTTNIQTTGKGTAGVLSLPSTEFDKYRNKPFYLESFYITQRELLDSVQRATGTTDKDWNIEIADAALAVAKAEEAAKNGDHLAGLTAFYIYHLRDGYGGDYHARVTDLSKIGLEKENLDETVKRVVQEVEGQ